MYPVVSILFMQIFLMTTTVNFVHAQSTSEDSRELVKNLLVNYHYKSFSDVELSGKSIDEMITAVDDRYTQYISAEEYQDQLSQTEQQFIGLGFSIEQTEQGFIISRVIDDATQSPTQIQVGDRIEEINGNVITGLLTLDEIYSYFRLDEHAVNQLKLARGNESLFIDIISRKMELPEVQSTWIEPNIGYLKLTRFSEGAREEFNRSIADFVHKGMSSLILDLRSNPGGYLGTAHHIFSHFVSNDVFFYMKNERSHFVPVKSNVNKEVLQVPVIILVNELSASASELLAGALKDYQIATIIGQTSYGKGTIQSIFPLGNEDFIKISTNEYYTPLRNKVHQLGIRADLEISSASAQLIAAFRIAGLDKITMQVSSNLIRIHHFEIPFLDELFLQGNKIYIEGSVLSAILNRTLTWEIAGNHLQVSSPDGQLLFTFHNQQWIEKEGRYYFEIKAVDEHSSEINVQHDGDLITLTIDERM